MSHKYINFGKILLLIGLLEFNKLNDTKCSLYPLISKKTQIDTQKRTTPKVRL